MDFCLFCLRFQVSVSLLVFMSVVLRCALLLLLLLLLLRFALLLRCYYVLRFCYVLRYHAPLRVTGYGLQVVLVSIMCFNLVSLTLRIRTSCYPES